MLILLASGCGGSSGSPNSTTNQQLLPVQAAACGATSGSPTTVSDAAKNEPYAVLMPSDPLASAATVSRAVTCPQDELIVSFNSGIRAIESASTIADPSSNWKAIASSDSVEASFGTVDNQPALLIDPAADPNHQAKGSVSFVLDGTLVIVEGSGTQSLDQLTTVSNTMEPVSGPSPQAQR